MLEDQEALETLEEYLRRGDVCLHGSQKYLQRVEPQQARCRSGRPEACLKAIYANYWDVRIPVLHALFSGEGVRRYVAEGAYIHASGDPGVTFMPGFVYVLPNDTFIDEGSEWVSYTPVTPMCAIDVTPAILWELLARGNFDLHIPIPPEW